MRVVGWIVTILYALGWLGVLDFSLCVGVAGSCHRDRQRDSLQTAHIAVADGSHPEHGRRF